MPCKRGRGNESLLEDLKTDLDIRRNKLDQALSETADEKESLENSRQKQIVKSGEAAPTVGLVKLVIPGPRLTTAVYILYISI